MLAFARDGSLAACATCWGIEPRPRSRRRINVPPVIAAGGSAHGSWAGGPRTPLRRRDGGDLPPLLRPIVSPSADGRAFLERLGYRHARTFWHMAMCHLDGTESGRPPLRRRDDPTDSGTATGRLSIASSRHRSRVTSAPSRWLTRSVEEANLRAPPRRSSHSCSLPSGEGSWSARSRRRRRAGVGGRAGRARGPPRGWIGQRSCEGHSPAWPRGATRSSSSTWTARTPPGRLRGGCSGRIRSAVGAA